MNELVGGVFVVVDDDDDETEVARRTILARAEVPLGRCLFVLWRVGESWGESVPVETTVIRSLLGKPAERDSSEWLFYGTGAVRTYDLDKNLPKSTWMWVGCRREGPKAYRRKQVEVLDDLVIENSTIPVSHKVFTRDIANNLWHLEARNCLEQTIRRIQSLTTWSDEFVIVHFSSRSERWKHEPLACNEGLVPVAEKVIYECDGIDLMLSGKRKSKKNPLQQALF